MKKQPKATTTTPKARKPLKTAKKRVKATPLQKDWDYIDSNVDSYATEIVKELQPLFIAYYEGKIKREQFQLEANDYVQYALSNFAYRITTVCKDLYIRHSVATQNELYELVYRCLDRDGNMRAEYKSKKEKIAKAGKWNELKHNQAR